MMRFIKWLVWETRVVDGVEYVRLNPWNPITWLIYISTIVIFRVRRLLGANDPKGRKLSAKELLFNWWPTEAIQKPYKGR